jgi:hypothetical protein
MVNVNNMERDTAIMWINYYYFHYFSFNNRELIIVMCRKSVLIDAFVLNKIINIMTEVTINS